MRLAYLGPRGTYTEAAAIAYDPTAELLPRPSFTSAVEMVEAGEADGAVCAIENSIEGPVVEVRELLLREQSAVLIRSEVVVPIRHALAGVEGIDLASVRTVYSHPQEIGRAHV